MNKLKAKSKKFRAPHQGCYFLLFIFYFLLVACAQQPSEPQPPDIAYGRDICDSCGMIISDARFAAATILADGKGLKFDDPGEMLAYHARRQEIKVRAWFVHDYVSQKWIPGQDAFYVIAPEVKSPMGTGTAAFSNRAEADAFAARLNVKAMTFDEVNGISRTSKMGH